MLITRVFEKILEKRLEYWQWKYFPEGCLHNSL